MKLLVFDIDGTLLNVGKAEITAFQIALKEYCSIENVNTNWDIYKNRTDTGIVYANIERTPWAPTKQKSNI